MDDELAADLLLLDDAAASFAAVDASLRRLNDGTYGTCEICTTPLDRAALTDDPTLARCPVHQG